MDWSPVFISVSGAIILMLIGIIGYFVRKQLTASDKIEASVNKLDRAVIKLESSVNAQAQIERERHFNINKVLDSHELRIKTLEK